LLIFSSILVLQFESHAARVPVRTSRRVAKLLWSVVTITTVMR
jgi:hypothetical protein